MRILTRLLVVTMWAAATAASPACLVLSLNPAYEAETIGWEPALLGAWADADDKSSMDVEGGEWKSYRIKYVHPIETGTLTGYLTAIGDERFLDVMPARGEDRGSFLIPAHVVLRVKLDGDRLELTPLSYDWMNERLRAGTRIPGIAAVLDQKENALFVSPTAALRAWLRKQPRDGPMFGAAATFTRKSAQLHEVR
jgi:hypothetical protein